MKYNIDEQMERLQTKATASKTKIAVDIQRLRNLENKQLQQRRRSQQRGR